MSIVVAHAYSTMYANQRQVTDEPAGPLSAYVQKVTYGPAIFGKGGVVPSTKAELDRYSDEGDFYDDDDSAWSITQWASIATGKHYRWNGSSWQTASLGVFDGFDGADPEGYFDGRWPATKKELDTVDPGAAFTEGQFVCIVGRDAGDQYFWDGDQWVAGAAPA